MKPVVYVQRALDGPRPGVPGDRRIGDWTRRALRHVAVGGKVTVRMVEAGEGANLNRTYRGRDAPTNVLSFPFEDPPGVTSGILGDIVICAPVVEREAAEQGRTPAACWAHMVVHGVLHLCGYDHQHDDQAAVMERLESDILTGFGFPDPYQGDSGPQSP